MRLITELRLGHFKTFTAQILLCSDCRVGRAKARSLEVTTVPEPGSILLEQWTVSVAGAGQGAGTMTGAQLLQAVRSYLHFSQLSAWYSKTQGTRPWNVLIRVTIPGQEFATKFTRPPEQHYFPAAGGAGAGNISVSVRSLPRTDDIPTVVCAHTSPAASSPDSEEAEDTKLGIAGALAWRERDQGDLRRSLVKAKLVTAEAGDCPGPGRLTKSDSMDSMLGDSLLDPPPSLAKMPPKRYQSPSRCGSPSLEAPEPLMSGYRALYEAAPPPAYDQAMAMRGAAAGDAEADSMEARLNRHDLLRRRDLTLFHGLHPRLFHPGHLHQPRLSLPPKQPAASALPCRAVAQPPSSPGAAAPPGPVVTDRLPLRCTIAGKHICQFEEEVQEEAASPASPGSASEAAGPSSSPPPALSPASPSPPGAGCRYRQEELGAKAKGWSGRVVRTATPYSRDSSSDSSQAERRHGHAYTPHRDADCHGEIEDVLNYLKTRNSPISSSKERMDPVSKDEFLCCKTSRRPSLEEIFDKQNLKPSSSVTQVYRTEINCNNNVQVNQKPDRTNLLLEAILRPQKTESGGSKAAPEIHSLRETSKYCTESGDSGSESAASPLSPDCDQLLLPWTREHRGRGDEETNNNNSNSNLTDGVDIKPGCEAPLWPTPPLPLPDLGLGDLCQDLQTKCLITKKDIGVQENASLSTVADPSVRIRSFSETCGRHPDVTARLQDRRGAGPALQPLDFTFEEYDESWSVLDDSCESLNNNNGSCGIVGDKRRKSIEDDDGVPSANKKNAFRKSFDSAASMVFQRRTGLPLTSSPAPMRRGIKFDFDSGINTPKDIKRALFEAQSPEESECGSPKKKKRDPRRLLSTSAPATISSNNLLCNFEESVLNGRLEPVSTVEGFTAEIGASGSFQPKHLSFPVTVFFYTLCENSNYASPYLVSHMSQLFFRCTLTMHAGLL